MLGNGHEDLSVLSRNSRPALLFIVLGTLPVALLARRLILFVGRVRIVAVKDQQVAALRLHVLDGVRFGTAYNGTEITYIQHIKQHRSVSNS